MNKITLVTGLWDIKRSELTEGWNRSFEDHYLVKFKDLLKLDEINLIVFGDKDLESFVYSIRTKENCQFIIREQEWFKNELFDRVQEIRNQPEWYNQAGWLPESTQAKLEMYNPLVMSKMFLLNDARILDQFNSDYMFWIDAGLSTTVHTGYFSQDNVLEKVSNLFSKFTFIAFPYEAETEIHGFSYPKINEYAGQDVKLVGRGGFFGGPKDTIQEANGVYYPMLSSTLADGYMGTEESIFSILLYKYPDLFDYVAINGNGLINKFFEDLKIGD